MEPNARPTGMPCSRSGARRTTKGQRRHTTGGRSTTKENVHRAINSVKAFLSLKLSAPPLPSPSSCSSRERFRSSPILSPASSNSTSSSTSLPRVLRFSMLVDEVLVAVAEVVDEEEEVLARGAGADEAEEVGIVSFRGATREEGSVTSYRTLSERL